MSVGMEKSLKVDRDAKPLAPCNAHLAFEKRSVGDTDHLIPVHDLVHDNGKAEHVCFVVVSAAGIKRGVSLFAGNSSDICLQSNAKI